MLPKRLFSSALILASLGAASAAPPALSAGTKSFVRNATLKCPSIYAPPMRPIKFQLNGTVDATTEPGQPVTMTNVTARLGVTLRDLYPFVEPFTPSTYNPHLTSVSLGVVGGTPTTLDVAGLPRALGPVSSVNDGGYEAYTAEIPSLELPPVTTSGAEPVAIRLNSVGVAFSGSVGSTTLCRVAIDAVVTSPTLAFVPSTGPLPAAPTLEPLAVPYGPLAGGNVVTLRGTNLKYVSSVIVGPTGPTVLPVGNGVTVKDDQTVEVTMPPIPYGAEQVKLTAVSEVGQSNAVPYTYGFSTRPKPTITKVTPARIPDSQGAVELVVEGTGFDRALGISFHRRNGTVLETNAAGTRLRAKFTRDPYRTEGIRSASVQVRALEGCEGSGCLSEDTALDDVRLFVPTSDLPGFPKQPSDLVATRSGNSVTLTWTGADDSSVVAYEIFTNVPGGYPSATTSASARTATLQLFPEYGSYGAWFFVRAVDADGDLSNIGDPAVVAGTVPDTVAPEAPRDLTAERSADPTVVLVRWSGAYDSGGGGVRGYDLFMDGKKIDTSYRHSWYQPVPVEGLVPSESHEFEVRAFDNTGNIGAGSTVTVPGLACQACECTGCEPDVAVNYAIQGSATFKTLVKGSAPLTGTLTGGTFVRGTGAFEADLALAPSTAKLTAYGFLPVVAQVAIVPTTKVTGALTGVALAATVKARIKIPQVSVFGVRLAGGSTCQTRLLSNIPLASSGPFAATTGGNLVGTFAMSDLAGCGALTGLVSPLTAGSSNAIAMALTPR